MAVNFCGNCGNKIGSNEVFCPKCGARTGNTPAPPVQQYQPVQPTYPAQPVYAAPQSAYALPPEPKQSPALAITAFVLSFVVPIVGLILGIIGIVKYKKQYRGFCAAAIALSASFTAIFALGAAIIVPSMLNYTKVSRTTSANSTASTIVHVVDAFLMSAENSGYGIKSGCTQEFDITVSGGVWTVSAADPKNFNQTDTVRWGSPVSERRPENSNNERDGETILAEALSDRIFGKNTASIHVVIKNGKCTAAAFTSDTSKILSAKKDYPEIGSDGRFIDPQSWQRSNYSSYNVGLAPLTNSGRDAYQQSI